MGLDILAATGLTRITQEEANLIEESGEGGNVVYLHNAKQFEDRLRPTEDGVYTYDTTASFSFRAGSYSGYSTYRDDLCGLIYQLPVEAIWAIADLPELNAEIVDFHNGDTHTQAVDFQPQLHKLPFLEQLAFSDCEGALGLEVCTKLADDYEKFDELASRRFESYTYKVYQDFRGAFELVAGADDGAVVYG